MNGYSNLIIAWYNLNRRLLPWRNTNDPYLIWVSEIILQQTRVSQGIGYYIRFVEKFPTVKALCDASEEDVLKYWQGLGYYSRARNLHKAAIVVESEFGGEFPVDYSTVIKLPGVGSYTAAAICSFAYNQPYAVLDGNVFRVLSRLYGINTPIDSSLGKAQFTLLAQELLNIDNPSLHNQAVMEFGALQCVPVSPDCGVCPLKADCKAYELNLVNVLPIKQMKVKVVYRYFNYLFIDYQGKTIMQKRLKQDIWQNLYEFPLIESSKLLSIQELVDDIMFKEIFKDVDSVNILKVHTAIKHVLTHRIIMAQFFTISISNVGSVLDLKDFLPLSEVDKLPVSKLIETFLESNLPPR